MGVVRGRGWTSGIGRGFLGNNWKSNYVARDGKRMCQPNAQQLTGPSILRATECFVLFECEILLLVMHFTFLLWFGKFKCLLYFLRLCATSSAITTPPGSL